MRSSIDIILNPSLKGLECRLPILPSIPPNSIIKLSQNNNSIYTVYQPSSDISTSRAQLPSKLCQVNGIMGGTVFVQPMMGVQQCRKLSVYVSKLDWQIISNQASRLQEQFMNQISIVWPNAILPLFYDRSNSVSLRVECAGLGYLVENSQLQILMEQSKSGEGHAQSDAKEQKIEQKEQQYKSTCVRVLPANMTEYGNINKIYIVRDHQIFQDKNKVGKIEGKEQNKIQSKQKQNSNTNNNNDNSKLSQSTSPGSSITAKNKSNINKNNAFKQQHQQQYKQGKQKTTKQLQQWIDKYGYKLQYKPVDVLKQHSVPCDTNKLSVKEQIALIKQAQNQQSHNVQNIQKQNKQKKNKETDDDSMLDILVQVQVIDIDELVRMERQYYEQTGLYYNVYDYHNEQEHSSSKSKGTKSKSGQSGQSIGEQQQVQKEVQQKQKQQNKNASDTQKIQQNVQKNKKIQHKHTQNTQHTLNTLNTHASHKQQQPKQQQEQNKQPKHTTSTNTTVLYINQLLLTHWGINPNHPPILRKIPRINQTPSKKLQHLLNNVKNISISVHVSLRYEHTLHAIKQAFIDGFVDQLTKDQVKDEDKGKSINNNGLTIYSKIPYIFNINHNNNKNDINDIENSMTVSPSAPSHKQKDRISAFVHIKQNDTLISDPLTVVYSVPSNAKQNKDKNKNMDKNKSEKIQQQEHKFKQQKQHKIDKNKHQTNKSPTHTHTYKINNNENINQLKTKLRDIVKITNYFYNDQTQTQTKTIVQVLNKINNALIVGENKMTHGKLNRNRSSIKQKEIFIELYKVCYREEIGKVIHLLEEYKGGLPKEEGEESMMGQKDEHEEQKQQEQQETLRYQTPSPKQPQQKPGLCTQLPIMITSFSNNGKTVMNTILRQHNYHTLYIDLSQFDDTSHNLSDLSTYLQLVFQLYQGDLIFMDNLDSVCYKIDNGDLHRKQERIAAKLLIRKIVNFGKMYNKICVFTAKNDTNVDEELCNYQVIKLKNPSREIRELIAKEYYYKIMNKKQSINIDAGGSESSKVNLVQIHQQNENENENSEAKIKQKIQQIITNSESMSFGQFSKYIISGHRQESTQKKGESVQNFSKLAGIKQAKNSIRSIIQRPLKYNFVFKKLPIKFSRGVLLYGGSGTGKTAIGQALAGQFMMKFFSIKGSDILSKYIGGSEAAVRDIFQKAMSVSPSIIFFDQFQSIVPRRNSSNTGVTDRVVNQFLCYLDGVASVEGVYIMAASSRPELIDPALLRPGRIDTHIYLDYPNKQQREQLFNLYSNSVKFQTSSQQLLKLTEGYSYSDLIGLIKQLRIKQSTRIIKRNSSSLLSQSDSAIDVSQFKFIDSLFLREIVEGYKISVGRDEQKRQREKYLAFKRGDAIDISKQKTTLQ